MVTTEEKLEVTLIHLTLLHYHAHRQSCPFSSPFRGHSLHKLEGHTDVITSHQFDATTLASASMSGQLRVWDLRAGDRAVHVLEHGTAVHAFQFDGSRLVSEKWVLSVVKGPLLFHMVAEMSRC